MSTPPTAPTSHAKHAARPRRPLRRAQCHPEGLRVWRPQLTLHPPRVSISWQSRGVQVAHPEFRQSGWGVKADYLEIPLGYASDTKFDATSKTARACLAETS